MAAYLREPTSARQAAARAAMPPPGPAPEWVVRTELRDVSGRLLLSAPGPAAQGELRFTTLDAPLFTTKHRGIGLGLALSKSLAQANGGDLILASRAGEGARFVFTLPLTRPRDRIDGPRPRIADAEIPTQPVWS